MDEEVEEVVGAKGRHDPDRVAVRHRHEGGEVTLGGRQWLRQNDSRNLAIPNDARRSVLS
jgi:hypothetical protein